MLFRKSLFKTLAAITVLTAFCVSQSAAEEEKSLWQKFVDWFKPAPTLEGEGPLYDEGLKNSTNLFHMDFSSAYPTEISRATNHSDIKNFDLSMLQ